jgi:prolyl-tRNA editing enzyme YbaK/EbsC (Cys-tRNA(Pro) deacylase)
MDPRLLDHATIWAAAGTPSHVFSVDPARLRAALNIETADFTA